MKIFRDDNVSLLADLLVLFLGAALWCGMLIAFAGNCCMAVWRALTGVRN